MLLRSQGQHRKSVRPQPRELKTCPCGGARLCGQGDPGHIRRLFRRDDRDPSSVRNHGAVQPSGGRAVMQRIPETETTHRSRTVVPIQTTCSGPLYVDMAGTLLATDMLWEMLVLLLKTKPALLLRALFWLIKGKAFFKQQLASHITLDP